jgi:hypothetical protein
MSIAAAINVRSYTLHGGIYGGAKPMPWDGLKNLGLLPFFRWEKIEIYQNLCRPRSRRTLMNLTTFFPVSYSALHIVIPGDGKRVQVPRGPAAVNGDETRECHCPVEPSAISSQHSAKS